MKWKRGTARIDCRSGPMAVDAVLSGPFAVHRSGTGWALTHRPTGTGILPVRTMTEGKELAARISELDWNFTDWRDMPEETREAMFELTRGGTENEMENAGRHCR